MITYNCGEPLKTGWFFTQSTQAPRGESHFLTRTKNYWKRLFNKPISIVDSIDKQRCKHRTLVLIFQRSSA